jgi:hypothetical protein
MRQVTMILGAVAVVLALAGVASATMLDNFESGYSVGSLDTQNGWSVTTGNMSVSSTAGKGPSWGFASDPAATGWNQVHKAHGEALTTGSVVVLDVDWKQTGTVTPPWTNGWTDVNVELEDVSNNNTFISLTVDNNNNVDGGSAISFSLYDHGSRPFYTMTPFTGLITGDWLHSRLTWTVGTSVQAQILDASNNVIYDETRAYAGLLNLTHVLVGSTQSAAINNAFFFDNVTVNPVPEPSALALLTTGAIGLLAYAWRKRR